MTPSLLQPASSLKTGLLLVDIQSGLTVESGYFGTQRSTPQFEDNVTNLLATFRKHNAAMTDPTSSIFIAHVKHNSTHSGSPLHQTNPGNKIMPCAVPIDGEPVISKTVNSGFIGTNLENLLRDQEIRQLIICGIATDHCVSTTVRMAADLNIVKRDEDALGVVAIISDATACFNYRGKFDAETVHAVNLASLDGEFAEIVSMKEVLDAVLGGKN